jgi:hypothetical protein
VVIGQGEKEKRILLVKLYDAIPYIFESETLNPETVCKFHFNTIVPKGDYTSEG